MKFSKKVILSLGTLSLGSILAIVGFNGISNDIKITNGLNESATDVGNLYGVKFQASPKKARTFEATDVSKTFVQIGSKDSKKYVRFATAIRLDDDTPLESLSYVREAIDASHPKTTKPVTEVYKGIQGEGESYWYYNPTSGSLSEEKQTNDYYFACYTVQISDEANYLAKDLTAYLSVNEAYESASVSASYDTLSNTCHVVSYFEGDELLKRQVCGENANINGMFTPTKTDYDFLGFATETNGDPLETLPAVTEDVSYYAIFQDHQVTVLKEARNTAKTALDNYRTADIEAIFCGNSAIGTIISGAKTALDSAADQAAIDTIVTTAEADIDAKITELNITEHIANSTVGTEEGFKDSALVPTGDNSINYIQKPGMTVLYHTDVKWVSFDMYLQTGVTKVDVKLSYGSSYFEEYKVAASSIDFSSNESKNWNDLASYADYGFIFNSSGSDIKSSGCNGMIGQWVTFAFAINPNNYFNGLAWGTAKLTVAGAGIYVKNFQYLTSKPFLASKASYGNLYSTDTSTHVLDLIEDSNSEFYGCAQMTNKGGSDYGWHGMGFSRVVKSGNKPVSSSSGKVVKFRFYLPSHGDSVIKMRVQKNFATEITSNFTTNADNESGVKLYNDNGNLISRLAVDTWLTGYVSIDLGGKTNWGEFFINCWTTTGAAISAENPTVCYFSTVELVNRMPA